MKWPRLILAFETLRFRRKRVAARLSAVAGVALLSTSSAPAQAPGAALTRIYTLPVDQGSLSGLLVGQDGNFYGTARNDTLHVGTIFRATPDGALTILHRFTDPSGFNPIQLRQDAQANLYGVTNNALAASADSVFTVFRLAPDGTLTTLHTFSGAVPSSLVLARDGNVYGVAGPLPTSQPGESGNLFRLTPDGTLTEFSPPTAHSYPVSLIQGADGNLYGTALQTAPAGSTVADLMTLGQLFHFTAADGTITTLARFNRHTGAPVGNLIQGDDGSFYNLGIVPLSAAGTSGGSGIKLTDTPPTGRRLVSLAGSGYTRGLTLGPDGSFYAVNTADLPGVLSSTGVILAANPNGTQAVLYLFPGDSLPPDASGAQHPLSPLVRAADGRLYGVASGADGTFIYRLDVTLPVATLTAPAPDTVAGGGRGEFVCTLSGSWPRDLTVAYNVTGTAKPGTDYEALVILRQVI